MLDRADTPREGALDGREPDRVVRNAVERQTRKYPRWLTKNRAR